MSTPIDNIKAAGRKRARSTLRSSGERAARLDQRRASHQVILRAMLPAIKQRFDPQSATNLEATFELQVRDPSGGEPALFELLVSERGCEARRGAARNPAATAKLGADDMIRLVSGSVGWPELVSQGRLELTGDPFLGLRFPKLFRLPAAASS